MEKKSIDLRNLKVGDFVYRVFRKNNFFSQKKIYMVDANGVEWYRYDKDRYEYIIIKYSVVGIVIPQIFGKVDDDEYHQMIVYLESDDENYDHYELYQPLEADDTDYSQSEELFYDLIDAELRKEELLQDEHDERHEQN